MLLKPTKQQFIHLKRRFERMGMNFKTNSQERYRVLYDSFSNLEIGIPVSPGMRATRPNYTELGMERIAGPPTDDDKELYEQVTSGGILPDSSLVTQMLLFDNDLIDDRYAIGTFNFIVGLYDQYLGRANDFNHSYDATEAYCRIIDVGVGADPSTKLNPLVPFKSLQTLSPMSPYINTYTALYCTLAFPNVDPESDKEIKRVSGALTKDVSLSVYLASPSPMCSICLTKMSSFFWFDYCEEHGFPGGLTSDGELVVSIWNDVGDVGVFGFVSSGAIRRAGVVLNPTITATK